MNDQKNTLLAIVLSALVLIGWQFYFGLPQMEKQKQAQQQQQQTQQQPGTPPAPGAPMQQAPGTEPPAPAQPSAPPTQTMSREGALAASPRVRIDTPSVTGSIALKGARIDDLSLVKYRETVDPK